MDDSGSEGPRVHGSRRSRGQGEAVRARAQARAEGPGEASLRAAVLQAARELDRRGLNQGSAGNVSARTGSDMIITPSAVPPRTMTSASLFRMPLSADQRANRPGGAASSEWRLHRDILRARPEAGAVVHCHAPHATALSLLRKPLPAAHYMIALMGGEVRCSAYAPFGSQELSDLAVAALEGRFAALLGNHGSVTIGVDLDEALSRAAELENLARIYLLALAAGEPVLLSQEQVAEAVSLFAAYRRPEPR